MYTVKPDAAMSLQWSAISMHACMHVRVCMMHVCMYGHVCVCMYVYVRMYVCMCACECS